MRSITVLGIAMAVALLAGCSGDTASDKEDSGPRPTGVAPASEPTAESAATRAAPTATTAPDAGTVPTTVAVASPTQVSADAPEPTATRPAEPEPVDTPAAAAIAAPAVPIVIPEGCAPGAPTQEQKATLVKIAKAMFPGVTDQERPRLQFEPEARDRRQGGIWLVAEFNGDELETIAVKKAALDRQMRDAYEAFFTSGCDELSQVDLTAIQDAVTTREIGNSISTPVVVYKTRLTRTAAEGVDWANKEELDFNEIWKTLLINPRWRKELREAESGP